MKIITIGDTHGKNNWEKIVEKEKDADKIIFIGDYFDSWDIPFSEQLVNFTKIGDFKIKNPDKVVLLLGNHDYHYLQEGEKYSGYQDVNAPLIKSVLKFAVDKGMIQIATFDSGYLFTHAGVTKKWCELANIDLKNLEGSLNKCFIFTPQLFKFLNYKDADPTGNNIWQSPIWVRPESLATDAIDGVKQVVGHTRFKSIIVDKNFIFTDALDSTNEYLIIQDDIPSIGTF